MTNFYVYAHYRPDNGQIFYIGKGHNDRAFSKHRRNNHWNNIVNKYNGFDVKILNNNLSEQKAFELEEQYIKNIGLENLSNMTLGGEGTSGFSPTEEHRKKISEANKGKIRSKQFCEKLSNRMKGNNIWLDKTHSDETRKKMSEVQKGKTNIGRIISEKHLKKISKSILQYSKDNQFIKEWKSAAEVQRILNIDQANIAKCVKHKVKSAGGFIWKYK